MCPKVDFLYVYNCVHLHFENVTQQIRLVVLVRVGCVGWVWFLFVATYVYIYIYRSYVRKVDLYGMVGVKPY